MLFAPLVGREAGEDALEDEEERDNGEDDGDYSEPAVLAREGIDADEGQEDGKAGRPEQPRSSEGRDRAGPGTDQRAQKKVIATM